MRSWFSEMAPHQPPPDPLAQAEQFANEAEHARAEWRSALLNAARMKLDDARAALRDGEAALSTQPARVAALMRRGVEQRRRAIDELANRIDALDRDRGV